MAILNRDFSSKIANSPFNTTLVPETSLIQTLILSGNYIPILILPKDGEVSFYSGNDLVIQTTINNEETNEAIDISTVLDATYILRTCSGEIITTKELGTGIFLDTSKNQLVIELDRTETLLLSGKYHHELQIVSPTGYSTIFAEKVTILDTIL